MADVDEDVFRRQTAREPEKGAVVLPIISDPAIGSRISAIAVIRALPGASASNGRSSVSSTAKDGPPPD
jgi:hypothetical protein